MSITNRNPKQSLPYYLRSVKFNLNTHLYDLTEFDIHYHLTYEQFNDLKKSFDVKKRGSNTTILEWYNNLNRFSKKKVKRSGDIPPVDTGFYPDEV